MKVQTIPGGQATKTLGDRRENSQQPEGRPHRPAVRSGRVGLYGLLVLAAVISLFPMFWLLSGSLQTREELYAGQTLVPTAPAWQNYVDAWVEGNLFIYLSNSILYTAISVAGILVVSSLAGYALARLTFAGKGLVTVAMLAVMIIPHRRCSSRSTSCSSLSV